MLGLRGSEVSQLYLVFNRISSKHKDHKYIEVSSVMKFFNIGENKFMNKAFGVLCKRRKKEIDFKQFVMLVWYFCTIENNLGESILKFLLIFTYF